MDLIANDEHYEVNKKKIIFLTDLFHCVQHLLNPFELYFHKNEP